MALRDQIRPASFRGVVFGVLEAQAGGLGRRVQTHEYPKRDRAYSEDMGAQTPDYSFQAFVRWENRDSLISACKKPGVGTLIHPVLGTVQVLCTDCSFVESSRTAGTSTFSLAFVDAGENSFPTELPNTAKLVGNAASSSRIALIASFVSRYGSKSVSQWVSDWATTIVGKFATSIRSAVGTLPNGQNLDQITLSVTALVANASQLVSNPQALGDQISTIVRQLADVGPEALRALGVLELFSAFGDDFEDVSQTTPNRKGQADRQEAFKRLARSSAAIEAARRAAEIPLGSYDAAVAVRERLVALLGPEIEAAGETGDDVASGALEQVLVEVVRDLRVRGAELARVRKITLDGSVPSVVLAYRLYEDAGRDAEVVERNAVIRHPGFIPAGVELEVLSA